MTLVPGSRNPKTPANSFSFSVLQLSVVCLLCICGAVFALKRSKGAPSAPPRMLTAAPEPVTQQNAGVTLKSPETFKNTSTIEYGYSPVVQEQRSASISAKPHPQPQVSPPSVRQVEQPSLNGAPGDMKPAKAEYKVVSQTELPVRQPQTTPRTMFHVFVSGEERM